MWNYNLVIPNFCVLITFLIFYFSKPRLPVKINRSFIRILIVEMIAIGTDVISSLCLEHHELYPNIFLRLVNILFFATFLLRSFFFFLLTCDALKIRIAKTPVLAFLWGTVLIATELISVLNIHWDLLFSITEKGFARASYYNIIYVCAFFYVSVSILFTLKKIHHMPKWVIISTLSFNGVLFLGYILRINLPKYLIMDSFCLLAIIIIYTSFETPSLYIENRTGNFNKKAMFNVMEEKRGTKCQFIAGFVIYNYRELREMYSNLQMDMAISLIGQYLLKTFPKLVPFYVNNGEFVLLGNDGSVCDKVEQELMKQFKNTWQVGEDLDILLEIGFANVESGILIEDPDLIIKGLNAALTKLEGIEKNHVTVTQKTLEVIEENTEVHLAMERAIEQDSVELFLQPVVDANTHKLVGAEALARIRDSFGNIVPPTLFIPLAERNGRINMLGKQMFEKTCKFISEHDIEAMGISWINVNVSPVQCLQYDLNEQFTSILKKYNVDVNKIHLEVTEAAMIDYALLQKQILQMKKSGFQFVLDDYGSGYSNVSRLKKCPFINVKLDMEIVWDYFKVQDEILPTLVQVFKRMNFTVTAEGIESKDMALEMKKIGCDYLQGFCFDQPLPAKDFSNKYEKNT